jgi:G3E family GTPase
MEINVMGKTRLILVGGFLGAGKTTLLGQLAKRLSAQGMRVGLITNDQAPDLVDTGVLSRHGMPVQEVSGSCFCCNFPGFLEAVEKLQHEVKADVIIAEPVGSCTDLSATILQPLKDKYRQRLVLAPFSVLVDPERVRDIFTNGRKQLHDSAAYIVRKQMEEADTIVINKSDLLSSEEMQEISDILKTRYPGTELRHLSARNGDGVDEWLSAVLASDRSGCKVVAVDYDTYAEGEAVLGWLNAAIRLSCHGDASRWQAFFVDIANGLKVSLQNQSAAVGHLKMLLTSGDGRCVASLTRTDGDVMLHCDIPSADTQSDLIINARVELSPEQLEQIVREQLKESCDTHRIDAKIINLKSLMPGRPNPTYRYDRVVGGL